MPLLTGLENLFLLRVLQRWRAYGAMQRGSGGRFFEDVEEGFFAMCKRKEQIALLAKMPKNENKRIPY
jgi:hypothetical protein